MREKYTYFLSSHYKLFQNDRIEERTLLNGTNNSLDPTDYHVEKCGIDAFQKLENELIHTFWLGHRDGDGEVEGASDVKDVVEENEDLIETKFCDGNNEVGNVIKKR